MKPVRLIITGGTIDGFENEDSVVTSSLIPRLLEDARITAPIVTEEIFLKDSRNVDVPERESYYSMHVSNRKKKRL